MTDSEYDAAFGSCEGEAVVWYDWEWTVMAGERGLSGVTGREWARYHANTTIKDLER
jgi:hypothetical protein